METVELGEVRPGVPVFVDRNALEGADLIVPINRVKPHTDFSGEIESGLMKMIAIGLGKQKGADTFHRQGFATFHELIPAVAEFTLASVDIPFGLALVENGHARLGRVEAVPPAHAGARERELLVWREAADGAPAPRSPSTCSCSTTSARTSAAWAWIPTWSAATTTGPDRHCRRPFSASSCAT